MLNIKKLLLAVILSNCAQLNYAHAALITIDSECSIQDAVISANTGALPTGSNCEIGDDGLDLISVPEHVNIQLSNADGDDNFMEIDSEIIIRGNRAFELDGNSSARHFYVTSRGDLTIIGGTLTRGQVDSTVGDVKNGGAIYSEGGNVTLSFSSIVNNRVTATESINAKGAAIFMNGGELSLERSLIENNRSGSGAIALANNATIISNTSLITQNTARFSGGAIFTDQMTSTITLDNTNVTNNTAMEGGAIFSEGATIAIDKGSISGNAASVSGGALLLRNSALTLNTVAINDNSAIVHGGAIALEGDASLDIVASSFFRNNASSTVANEGTGGALFFQNSGASPSQQSIINSTFVDNNAMSGGTFFIQQNSNSNLNSINNTILIPGSGQNGSGIFVGANGHLALNNSIVSFKDRVTTNKEFAPGSGELCDIESGGVVKSLTSLIDDSTCGAAASGDPMLNGSRPAFFVNETVLVGRRVNQAVGIERSMRFIQPLIHVPLFDSPALDSGNTGICNSVLGDIDQRGESRATDICDIGAVEAKREIFVVSRNGCNFESTLQSIGDRKAFGNIGCKDGADLNTISFTQEDIQNQFDVILNDRATINSSIRLLGPGRDVFKIISNGGFLVQLDGRLYMRGITIDGFVESAVHIVGGSAILEDVVISNTPDPILVQSGRVTIKDSQLMSNSSSARGRAAGVTLNQSIGDIDSTSIVNNTHTSNNDFTAGGITVNFGSTLNLVNSTVSGNSAQGDAGGIIVINSELTMTNTTVVNNSAVSNGGGLYIASQPFGVQTEPTTVNLFNSIIAGNRAALGGSELSINRFGGPEVELLFKGNLIGTNELTYDQAIDDILNITGAEIDSQLLTELTMNGSQNANQASLSSVVEPLKFFNGSFIHNISAESLARDAADEQFCVNKGRRLQVDQINSARDQFCDIGAIEFVEQMDSVCVPIKTSLNKVVVICL